jgi:hypothetical protein
MSKDDIGQKEAAPVQKFVAIVDDPDKGITFNLMGVNMDEALALVAKGYIKFQKQYERYLRNQDI